MLSIHQYCEISLNTDSELYVVPDTSSNKINGQRTELWLSWLSQVQVAFKLNLIRWQMSFFHTFIWLYQTLVCAFNTFRGIRIIEWGVVIRCHGLPHLPNVGMWFKSTLVWILWQMIIIIIVYSYLLVSCQPLSLRETTTVFNHIVLYL